MQSEQFLDLFGTNAEYVQALYLEYQNNPGSVPTSWRNFFEGRNGGESRENGATNGASTSNGATNGATNGSPATPTAAPARPAAPTESQSSAPPAPVSGSALVNPTTTGYETAEPIRGVAAKIVQNMEQSLGIPVATSQRTLPVKVMEENRRLMNQHLELTAGGKVSFTHIIAWALVEALKRHPGINNAYAVVDGRPTRLVRSQINLGVAVDLERKDGTRSLVVPNIKNAGELTFDTFRQAYDALIDRARRGANTPDDFQGTTVTLTNPGTIGTVASMPRLMVGQGAIISTGAIGYPAEFHATSPAVLSSLGVSKILTIGNTYDHRIIQGAESGQFLAFVERLLQGEENFYDHMFADLRIPYTAVRWTEDTTPALIGGGAGNLEAITKQTSVIQLIRAYRVRGHLIANLDPLVNEPSYHPDLDPATYGLTLWDLDREFITGGLGNLETATLRQVLDILRRTYCGHVGLEFMNIQDPIQRHWLQNHVEHAKPQPPLPADQRKRILERLTAAEAFEQFLHRRYIGHKRFSLEGAEALVPVLDTLFSRAAERGMVEVVVGMAHRGRLNVLANTVGKSPMAIFSEFEGNIDPNSTQGSGDVKYHLGAVGTHTSMSGSELTITLAPNPSHLEAVDPVVEGITRAKQDLLGDEVRERVLPVLLHGDGAFAGQGIVTETLNLAQLKGYRTGGTIHIIINNQIGFTTAPQDARSTPFATDVAKMSQVPIFHVNGDDPDAAVRVIEVALAYRQEFKKDVVIDLICYRRWGHNESDDPSYTQPVLYQKIEQHPTVRDLYAGRLAREKVVSREESDALKQRIMEQLEAGTVGLNAPSERPTELRPFRPDVTQGASVDTWVSRETLVSISRTLATQPAGFNIHPKLERVISRRELKGDGSDRLDWAMGEALAFGSLLLEGTPVRLSGQDVGRGTFSHRHAVLYNVDQSVPEELRTYVPLNSLKPGQAHFQVFDSMLSENAVLGFEFGYSLGDPKTLVLWEAQFGDFVNGAQIIIDQFLSSSASKWGREAELVLLLPHGFEGQGPEHSSARLERFLQLCAEDNMQVCNATTPAQYFHLLRRQMRDSKKRPLVIVTPKSLLRLPAASSSLDEFTRGGFQEVIDDTTIANPANVQRVVFTSGKLFYDLIASRKNDQVAIVRVEQYYPYPRDGVRAVLSRYPNAREVVWAQEEPRNMGAWTFISFFLGEDAETLRGTRLRYIGRPASASPATGSLKVHQQEQAAIVSAVWEIK